MASIPTESEHITFHELATGETGHVHPQDIENWAAVAADRLPRDLSDLAAPELPVAVVPIERGTEPKGPTRRASARSS